MPSAAEVIVRTAVAADLPELQRVYRAASLSNDGDAPLLLARPEFLVFSGDRIADGWTRTAVGDHGRVLGFATVVTDAQGVADLEDLFVDPAFHRLGIARGLVVDAARSVRSSGGTQLLVTANPHAMAFYTSVGFIDIGEVSTELGSGSRMQLDTGLSSLR